MTFLKPQVAIDEMSPKIHNGSQKKEREEEKDNANKEIVVIECQGCTREANMKRTLGEDTRTGTGSNSDMK